MKTFAIGTILIFIQILTFAQNNVIRDGNTYYLADRIVIKYSEIYNLSKTTEGIRSKFNIVNIESPIACFDKQLEYSEELNKIFVLQFSSPYNPLYVVKEISKISNIEWAEPYFLYEPTFVPNDPYFQDADSLKYAHLKLINAEKAWDINIGDENIIIAIIDTGIDWDHPDLEANIWENKDEIANNGVDDDGNGFIDDTRGWDFGGWTGVPDNDPSEDAPDHGTHVAGLASAVTNNGIGIASIGFNCKLMAVKTSRNDVRNDLGTALISNGYEGIIYAVNNGADIINCSWGGYNYSNYSQSVIDYAISNGALVVASAGNDNSSENFYPASYKGVLSVGGTNFVDQKASWSNYGNNIDVTAPGVNIFSTWQGDQPYKSQSGTSMSAPITAGLAALVKNQFPDYTPLQVAEQIRVTSDYLYLINPSSINKLGFGRINAEKALTEIESKSVRITKIENFEVGNNNSLLESGENVKVKLEITNYLHPINNLRVSLTTSDTNVTVTNGSIDVGSISTLESKTFNSNFFEFQIRPNASVNSDVDLLVTYTDNNYSDFEWITISINPTYQIHKTENLTVTFNSNGSIGFDDYPTNLKGTGLIYKDGSNLLFEGALIYGNSANSIINSSRDEDGNKDLDFSTILPISLKSSGLFSDIISYTKFNDIYASPNSLGIETEVYTYSFNSEADIDYIMMRYVFTNTTSSVIENFHAGQYWDFDLDDTSYDDDIVSYNDSNKFAYVKDNDGNPTETHIGLTIFSENDFSLFAMDNDGSSNPTISWDGFTDNEKWIALTSKLEYSTSGPSDISLVISDGPFSIEQDSSISINFGIIAGENFEQLQSNIIRAREKFSTINFSEFSFNDTTSQIFALELKNNYPNPFNSFTTIGYDVPSMSNSLSTSSQTVLLDVYNILGEKVTTLVNEKQEPGEHIVNFNGGNLTSGVYLYRIQINGTFRTKKMLLLK